MPILQSPDVLNFIDNSIENGGNFSLTEPSIKVQMDSGKLGSSVSRFQKRGEAFYEGMLLLIDNMPTHELGVSEVQVSEKRMRLKNAITKLHEQFNSSVSTISAAKQGKREFDRFLSKTTLLLEDQTALNAKTIAKQISLSERVHVWKGGRKPLITVSTLKNPEQIIVQAEIPRVKLTPAQQQEFLDLLQDTSQQEKLPQWFINMPQWEKNYLLKHLHSKPTATRDNINEKIATIPASLRHIPGLANFSEHVLRVYEKNAEGNYVLKTESRRERSGIVAPVDLYRKKFNLERQRLTNGNVGQLLASTIQERAERYVEKWDHPGDKVITIPFTLQTLLSPGWLNALIGGGSNNNTMMIENKQMAVSLLRHAFEFPESQSSQRLFQQWGLDVDEQGAIRVKLSDDSIVRVKPAIISTNHSVNAWRRLPGLFKFSTETENKTSALQLIAVAQDFIRDKDQNDVDIKLLQQALDDYQATPSMANSNHHRALFLSSLEQIISDKSGGIAYGSCKSGKDRKGMETLHTDTMLVYQSRYGYLPKYNDSGIARENFVNIFVELYFSMHHQEVASQNALGAEGIKELEGLLPQDIKDAIKRKQGENALLEANLFGGLNKVNNKLLRSNKQKQLLMDEINNDAQLQHSLSPTYYRSPTSSIWSRASTPYTKSSTVDLQKDFSGVLDELQFSARTLRASARVNPNLKFLTRLMTSKRQHLIDPLNKIINLIQLSQTSTQLTREPYLSQTENAIKELRNQIMERYQDADGNALTKFSSICDAAITNLRDRANLLPGLSHQTELIEYDGTPADFEAKLQQYNAHIKNDFLATITCHEPMKFTNTVDKTHFRVSPIDKVPGAIIVDQMKEGKLTSMVMSVPDNFQQKTIWQRAYATLLTPAHTFKGLTRDDLDKLFDMVSEIANLQMRDISKEDIALYLKNKQIPDPNKTSEALYKAYTSVMYREKFKGEIFPNDTYVNIAIKHVESRRQLEPNQPIVIRSIFNPIYLETLLLYCRSQGYAMKGEGNLAGIEDRKIAQRRVNAFLELLETHPNELNYTKNQRAEEMAARTLRRPRSH